MSASYTHKFIRFYGPDELRAGIFYHAPSFCISCITMANGSQTVPFYDQVLKSLARMKTRKTMLQTTTISMKRCDDISPSNQELDKISIDLKSHNLLKQLLQENPDLDKIMKKAKNEIEALKEVRNWIMGVLEENPESLDFYKKEYVDRKTFESIKWSDYASIRLLDYLNNARREFEDLNLRGEIAIKYSIFNIFCLTCNEVS